jgi:peroxisomal membrane protein 4
LRRYTSAYVWRSSTSVRSRGRRVRHTVGIDRIQETCSSALLGKYDTFFAGLLGGYVVFGRRSPRTGKISSVNQQIVIYVFARVVLALAKMAVQPSSGFIKSAEMSEKIKRHAWPIFASISWGLVMWIFRWHPDSVQPSLRSSMKYIYVDSDHWNSLRNLLWHNK